MAIVCRTLRALLICLVAVGPLSLQAADWPHWRGPSQDGTSAGNGAFDTQSFGLDVAWSRPLGIAYSGISVVDGKAVTMFADGENDYLVAIDGASGKEIWRYTIDTMFPSKGGSEGGPVSVPAIDDGVIYGLGAKGHLFAVNMRDGSEIWSMRIDEKLGAQAPHFGFTTSPLIIGDVLFIEAGGTEGRAFAGLDKKTGELLWSAGDDTVAYQSPVPAKIGGREQILAVGNKTVVGLDPENGKVLWSHEHGTSERDGAGSPVLIGDDRFVLAGRREAAAFEVLSNDDMYAVDELWRSSNFKQSFATPVFHDGYLYGYSGDFLTCVSPETGEKVWKSRPPGGRGLIVVDGHLVIFGADGMLVIAEASPEGYREKARVKVSERGSYTYPSFADGTIFVRNTVDIAGITIDRDAPATASKKKTAPSNDFERFLHKLAQAENKKQLVDEFMSEQKQFPILENDRLVHFVYRGEADDVAITGNMTELRAEEPMDQVEGTNLYYKTYAIETGARWEYKLNVNFENPQVDPLNPRITPSSTGDMSELVTPGWSEPSHIKPFQGDNPGRVESFDLESKVLETTRKIQVYLPPGYDDSERAYSVVILNDGNPWIELADLPNSLNNLIGSKIEPVIAVFVELPRRAARDEFGGAKSADHVKMLADELVPYLDESYRTKPGSESRGILGAGSGATMAAFAAIQRPDVFGKSGGCSVYLAQPLGDELIGMIENNSNPQGRFRVIWNRYEYHRAEWDLDFGADSRRMVKALEASGFNVDGEEAIDGSGWGSWRAQVATVLTDFFPM